MRASGLRLGKAAVLQDGRHESGIVRLCYSNIRDGGTRRVKISQRSPPRPLSWADGGVGEESGAKA